MTFTGERQNFQTDLIGNMVQPNLRFFLGLKSKRQFLCLEFRWLTHKLTLDTESKLHEIDAISALSTFLKEHQKELEDFCTIVSQMEVHMRKQETFSQLAWEGSELGRALTKFIQVLSSSFEVYRTQQNMAFTCSAHLQFTQVLSGNFNKFQRLKVAMLKK